MIDPKELRIGNIVLTPIGYEKCTTTTFFSIGLGFKYEPINITTEVLKKFGFEYDGYNWEYEGFKLKIGAGHKCYYVACDGNFLVPLTYLHQLQNLYYLLYKEDLPVDLQSIF